jgi:hypothetical protein
MVGSPRRAPVSLTLFRRCGTLAVSRKEVTMMTFRSVSRRRPGALLISASCALAVLLLSPAVSAVERAAESVNSGGLPATSVSYKAHDSVAQGAIGPLGQGATIRIYDGFWLGLPGINVPVEGAMSAALSDAGAAVLRWTVGSLADVTGFNVYRATEEDGPYARLNNALLAVQSPASFEDTTIWPETTFWYEVRALLVDGTEDVITGSPASVTTAGSLVLRLYPPRPNPGTGSRTFLLDIPDHAGPVRLAVYNVSGQCVRTVLDGAVERGRYECVWDGMDASGRAIATGVYFVRLEVDGRTDDQKIMVLR